MILDTATPLSVAFNVDPLNNENKFRGVGRYTARLLETLKDDNRIKVVEFTGNNIPQGVDVVHYPYFDFFFLTLPIIKRHKTIVTIHDCIPLVFPHQYPPGLRGKIKFNIQKTALHGVSLVITDSEASKKDITKYLKVPENKIRVIYLAGNKKQPASPAKLASQGERSGQTKNHPPYFLYAGDVNFNKNVPRLVEAFLMFNKQHDDSFKLILVGKAFENGSLPEIKELKKLVNGNPRIEFVGYVDDERLYEYYRNAFCYCQPSLYEGFGLQILEAMSHGVPVITSNASSCPEIAGNAGLLVNPTLVSDIVMAMNQIANNPDLRQKMIEKGIKQASNFSWEKTARETTKAYREVFDKVLSN